MLLLLSPAKKLDFTPADPELPITEPRFLPKTRQLVAAAQKLSRSQLRQLMRISEDLAELNHARLAAIKLDNSQSKQAMLAFAGDVYRALQASSMSREEWTIAQDHVRILSGLYGLLRPLDGIEPHRLEMGTRLAVGTRHSLYEFWGTSLARSLRKEADTAPIVNLASIEYSRVLRNNSYKLDMIECAFHELRNGHRQSMFMYTKRARGLMCRFAISENIDDPDGLKDFNAENYVFDPGASTDQKLVFSRPRPEPKSVKRRVASGH